MSTRELDLRVAVEAGAKAIAQVRFDRPQPTSLEVIQRANEAQAAIDAALPHLIAQIREGIAEAVGSATWEEGSKRGPLAGDSEETWMRGANDGIDFAQTIARNYGQEKP